MWYSPEVSSANPDAVATAVALLRTHFTMLGDPGRGEAMEETIKMVVRCFEEVGVKWCLVGAHAYGIYVEPRATADFDFVVDDRKLKKTLAVLERDLGDLGIIDIGAAVRLTTISVDLIRSSSAELFKVALAMSTDVGAWRVPPVEVLIALKFFSATAHWRGRDRRAQDTLDLVRLYKSSDPDELDRKLMRTLAAMVYPGAEREFEELVRKIDQDEPITV